jgi:hypothetical protein
MINLLGLIPFFFIGECLDEDKPRRRMKRWGAYQPDDIEWWLYFAAVIIIGCFLISKFPK